MTFTIEIDMETVFSRDVAGVLYQIAGELERGLLRRGPEGNIMDASGKRIGKWSMQTNEERN